MLAHFTLSLDSPPLNSTAYPAFFRMSDASRAARFVARPSRSLRAWFLTALTAAVLWSPLVSADETAPGPGENQRAMPGLLSLSLPTPGTPLPVVAVGAGYGLLDDTGGSADGDSSGHRAQGTLAAAFALHRSLSVGVDLRAHADWVASDSKGYGEPRLSVRFALPAGSTTFLGAEADARLVGAEAPSINFNAVSPAIRGLFAAQLSEPLWFGAQLGFHIDRSAEAVPNPERVLPADRRTLGASSWNAVQWGLGASYRLQGAGTEMLGEVGGDWLVGSDAPKFTESPWHLGVGVRHPLSIAFSVLANATLGLSSRPDAALFMPELLPAEPRLSLGAALVWRIGAKPEPARHAAPPVGAPEPPPPAAEPEEPQVQNVPVTGTVVDEGGHSLPDVEITLTQEGAEPKTARSAADGTFVFDEVPAGALTLTITTAGFDTRTIDISADGERVHEVVLLPSVPAGQVRGRVLDLTGEPIAAVVTVAPGKHTVEVGPDGSFALDLAPGRYTVKFRHPDFSTQYRKVTVHDRGVVILNIALTR